MDEDKGKYVKLNVTLTDDGFPYYRYTTYQVNVLVERDEYK